LELPPLPSILSASLTFSYTRLFQGELTNFGFLKLQLTEIRIRIAKCNERSMKVAEKIARKHEIHYYQDTDPIVNYVTRNQCPAIEYRILGEALEKV
jgi:RimJ/RimL family protein N-acetyltransferase